MTRRDQELLDKQLWGVSPRPARSDAMIGVILIVMFLIGVAIGGSIFSHENNPSRLALQEPPVSGSNLILN